VALFKRFRTFVVEQHCIPWRVRTWLGKRHPRLLVFLLTGHTNANTPAHWDAKWREAGPDGARWCQFPNKFARICNIVRDGADVLDIGCGAGILLAMLRDRRHCRCTGADISREAIRMVQANGMSGVVTTLPKLPLPDASFDYVIASELIEHLSQPELTLREMARVARRGGRLIVSTPDHTLGTEDEIEHLHTFTADSLGALLSHCGDVESVESIAEEGHDSRFLLAVCTVRKAGPGAGEQT